MIAAKCHGMNAKMYLELIKSDSNADAVSDIIDSMSHAERIELRSALESEGCQQLMRNLYFDYEAQVWI